MQGYCSPALLYWDECLCVNSLLAIVCVLMVAWALPLYENMCTAYYGCHGNRDFHYISLWSICCDCFEKAWRIHFVIRLIWQSHERKIWNKKCWQKNSYNYGKNLGQNYCSGIVYYLLLLRTIVLKMCFMRRREEPNIFLLIH